MSNHFTKVFEKLEELKEKGVNVEFHERTAKGIVLMDKQLSQDKALFDYLIENRLVNVDGVNLINEMVKKHTEDFEN